MDSSCNYLNIELDRKEKRSIIASLVTSFLSLTYQGISSYLYSIRNKALQKAFMDRENKVNLGRNKIFHLEDSMVMYSIYNSDTLEKLINTVYKIHSKTTWNESYLPVKLIIGITGIYPRKELATVLIILSCI